MTTQPSIYGKIMDEVFTTVESIGIERTCQILQDAKAKSLMLSDDTIDFFLEITCSQVGITKDVLLYGNERNDERKIALSLSIYFIKEELKYSYKQLKMVFNKDESALHRYYNYVKHKAIKPKSDFEKILETNFKKINILITEKKQKNGNK
jgi:hypothetical protein